MNWYLRGKLALVIYIGGSFFLLWLTEDVLHLGLLDIFDAIFGFQYGFVVWFLFWLFLIYGLFRFIRSVIYDRPKR